MIRAIDGIDEDENEINKKFKRELKIANREALFADLLNLGSAQNMKHLK